MSESPRLLIDGEVNQPCRLTVKDLAEIDPAYQIADISQLIPKKKGTAIRLQGLLEKVALKPSGTYLTLHASKDDFHASIPLAPIAERGYLIYSIAGQALSDDVGGPFRFIIEDSASCHTAEIDECANVKFVDRIEITNGKGFDNRPTDEQEHAALHEHE